MRRKYRLAAVIVVLSLCLAGCWDRAELEDQAYIVAMGIDTGGTGQIVLTAIVALVQPQKAGLYGGLTIPATPSLSAQILTARARTIDQAMHILNGGMTRRLDFRHLRATVVGEELSRSGLEPIIMELARSSLIRGSGLLVLARGRAFELLTKLKPVAELSPARAMEGLILQAKMLHLAPPVRMHAYLERLAAPGGDPFLPVLAVNPWVTTDPQEPPPAESESAEPGELQRGGGNPVEYIGTAIFRRDRLSGLLDVDETQMLLALRGEMGKAYTTIPDPGHPEQPVTIRLHQENKPQYQISLRGTVPRVHILMVFDAEVLAMPGGTDYTQPAARQRLEKAVSRHVNGTSGALLDKLRAWEADPLSIGHRFRSKFATYQDWVAYEWPKRIGEMQIRVESKVRIRRYALFTSGDRVNGGR